MNNTITDSREAATPRLAQLSTEELEMFGGTLTVTEGGVLMAVGILLTAAGCPEVGIPVYGVGLTGEALIATGETTGH